MNLKKLIVGTILVVTTLYFWQYVEPPINQALQWLHDNISPIFPTSLGFTYWLWGFIPIPIGFGTIVLVLGALLILFGLLA